MNGHDSRIEKLWEKKKKKNKQVSPSVYFAECESTSELIEGENGRDYPRPSKPAANKRYWVVVVVAVLVVFRHRHQPATT